MGRVGRKLPLWMVLGIIGGGKPFDYYVDSVNGDDGNTGRSSGSAFATISALSGKIAAGTRIGLARGSFWRESFNVSVYPKISVKAYGTGNRPVLNSKLIAKNTSFTKTDEHTNVYQISLSLGGTAQQFVNVWENGNLLVRVANIEMCDSTQGSVSVSAEYGDITLYIHASDSSNIITNENVYEYSGLTGLNMRGADPLLDGIEVRGSILDQGCVSVGQRARINDCLIADGGNHLLQLRGAATVTNTTIRDGYSGTRPATLVNYNLDTPAGENITISDCTIGFTNITTLNQGLNGHKNISGAFGTLLLQRVTFQNCAAAYGVLDIANVQLVDCIFTNNIYSITNGTNVATAVTTTGCEVKTNRTNNRCINIANGGSLTVSNTTLSASSASSGGPIYIAGNGALTISDCEVIYNGPGGTPAIYCNSATANITMQRNVYLGTVSTKYYFAAAASGMIWASDYNTFNAGKFNMTIFGTTYDNLSDYQVATGQDIHSTVAPVE